MIIQINRDNWLASKRKNMSNEAFSKWNRGMYDYDKNSSDLVLKQDINVSSDIPNRISNVVSASSIK